MKKLIAKTIAILVITSVAINTFLLLVLAMNTIWYLVLFMPMLLAFIFLAFNYDAMVKALVETINILTNKKTVTI